MKRFGLFLLAAALLAGCTAAPAPGTTTPQDTTVENIFTTPTTTGPEGTAATEETEALPYEDMGGSSFGFLKNDIQISEELGRYVVYEGGEMHLRFQFSFSGSMGDDGFGLLLLLDGIPQPYKTADNDEYSYLHSFYLPFQGGGVLIAETVFAPVTGKAGDVLDLTVVSVIEPDYSRLTDDPMKPFRLVSGGLESQTPMIMEADPPACPIPEVPERVDALSVTYEDLTAAEIGGMSAEALTSDYRFSHGFPGPPPYDSIYNMKADTILQFHAELFSPSFVDWSLVLYIDNKPVSVPHSEDLRFSVPNGKKAVVDMDLNLIGTDGDMPLYAILVPRNRHVPEVRATSCRVAVTPDYYLLSAANSLELQAQREQQ